MFRNFILTALAATAVAYDEDAFTSSAALASIDYSDQVAPADLATAVPAFDFGAEFITQNDYEASIDLTADILIAIEALAAEISVVNERISDITHLIDHVHEEDEGENTEF